MSFDGRKGEKEEQRKSDDGWVDIDGRMKLYPSGLRLPAPLRTTVLDVCPLNS